MKERAVFTQCNACERQTNQNVLFSKRVKKKISYSEENETEIFDYITMECAGCKTVSFLRRQYVKDFDETSKTVFIDNHYPDDNFDFYDEFNFLSNDDQSELPRNLYDLYEEVKNAFENGSSILAGIGLRTLVEAMCLHQKIPGNNLQNKIKNLLVAGLISSAELPILDKLRLIGNISTHEIKAISLDKLNYALDIINHVLKSIYVLPKINKKLKFK